MSKIELTIKKERVENRLQSTIYSANEMARHLMDDLSANQRKFISYVMSLNMPNDTEFREHTISVKEFSAITGVKSDGFYTGFQEFIDDFDRNMFWFDTDEVMAKFRWFDVSIYYKKRGTVVVKLSDTLKPFLLQLPQGNRTQYELYNIVGLKSKHAISLFVLLKSYAFQRSVQIDIDELKRRLNVSDTKSYNNFNLFNKRVLEPGMHEINSKTRLNISYKPINLNGGNRFDTIIFNIQEKEKFEMLETYQGTVSEILNKIEA